MCTLTLSNSVYCCGANYYGNLLSPRVFHWHEHSATASDHFDPVFRRVGLGNFPAGLYAHTRVQLGCQCCYLWGVSHVCHSQRFWWRVLLRLQQCWPVRFRFPPSSILCSEQCLCSRRLGLGYTNTTDYQGVGTPGPPVLNGTTSVCAGVYFTCVLMSSGGVRCWGANTYGQVICARCLENCLRSPAL